MIGTGLMDKLVDVQRQADAVDGGGHVTRAFAVVAAGVPAGISGASTSRMTAYAMRSIAVDTTILLAANPPAIAGGVKVGDRIVYGSETYVVAGLQSWSNARLATGTLYQLDCERLWL